MRKVHKINGIGVEELDLTGGSLYLKENSFGLIESKFNQLLEALSDKEELPKRGECTCACHITTSFGHTGKCCEGTEDVGNRVAPTGGFSGSSGVSLQERCEHKNFVPSDNQPDRWGICISCHKWVEKPTSLKERHKCVYVPYKWENYQDITNTQGNYIKTPGGKYTEYICVECGIAKIINKLGK